MTRAATFLFLLGTCFACSSNNKVTGIDAPTPDAPATADAPPATSTAVAAEGDFTAGDPGSLSSLDVVTDSTTENIVPGSVGDDPIIRLDSAAGFVYVVNRSDTDNVTQLDTALTPQLQLNTGSGTNPQDIAVIGTVWYVATLAGTGLEFVDTGSGSGATFTPIDLKASLAVPSCNSVILVGTNLYVSCELLDADFEPTGNGLITVIDTTTNTIAASFNLQHPNPFGLFESLPDGNIAIPTIDFDSGSGCIEEVNVGSNQSAGCIGGVENSAFTPYAGSGSYANQFAITADRTTMMIDVTSQSPSGPDVLVPFDLASSTLGSAMSPSTELITDVATCPDGLTVVADSGSGNGLRVYSATRELTRAAINIGVPPLSSHGLVCF